MAFFTEKKEDENYKMLFEASFRLLQLVRAQGLENKEFPKDWAQFHCKEGWEDLIHVAPRQFSCTSLH